MIRFHDVPEEVVLKIFKYLSHSQLHGSICRVCRQWHRICQDKALYKYLNLDAKLSLDVIVRIFRKYSTSVQSLVISGRKDTNRILKMVPGLTNLEILRVYPCSSGNISCVQMGSEVNADLLSAILEKNGHLKALCMTHSTIRPGHFKLYNHNLTELILKNAYYQRSVDEEGILLQQNLKLLNLQGLIMNKSILSEVSSVTLFFMFELYLRFIFFSQVISNNKNTLETLKLDVWEPQLGSNDQLMEAIGTCHNIKCLMIRNLSFYRISDEAIKCLKELRRLSSLKFSKLENVTSSAFCELFGKFHAGYLQKIHLSACDGLCSRVVKIIASSCPHLMKIAIHQPKATEENLINSEDILYLASKCTRLQLLDLCYTHISIGQALAEAISYLPALKEFKYCSNSSNERDSLNTIYNYLFVNLKDFNVALKCNSHMDKYVHGSRVKC